MSVAVVWLHLRPLSPVVVDGFSGPLVMSVVLNILGTVDPKLAVELHGSKAPKPISVTPLYHGDKVLIRGPYIVPPGEQLRFRVAMTANKLLGMLMEGLDNVSRVRIGNTEAVLEPGEGFLVTHDELTRVRGTRFRIDFLTPVRFAKRSTMGRRRRVRFDFCPSIINILQSALMHYSKTIGLNEELKGWPYLLRWAYNYVYMRDMVGRVVAVKHGNRPELGFLGSVEFEIKSKRQSRIAQLWTLLNYAENMNIGTGRSIGFGHIKITPTQPPTFF